jgi:hypothetical protein
MICICIYICRGSVLGLVYVYGAWKQTVDKKGKYKFKNLMGKRRYVYEYNMTYPNNLSVPPLN